jgi:hypothetical protein
VWVSDRGLVHTNVVIMTEINEFFPDELDAIVGVDGVRDSEIENDVLDKI